MRKWPKCINHGCNELAAPTRKKDDKPRIHCSRCQRASYGSAILKEGVTPYKKRKCNNEDGKLLGFPCPTDFSKIPPEAKAMTEVDHWNGNAWDDDLNNLNELCIVCHRIKSQLYGDHNKNKN